MCMENLTRKEAECDADMRDGVGRGVSASDDVPLARAADGMPLGCIPARSPRSRTYVHE